jgi:deazaflavin-dependent oxidoreductase (nitroreductase family)
VNRLLLALLRSPLHRLVSGGLLGLTVTGRRTGKPVTLPVQYAVDGDRLVVVAANASSKRWWRNLSGGAPLSVWWRGRPLVGDGRVLDGQEAAVALAAWGRRHPRAAERLGLDFAVVVIEGPRPALPSDQPAGSPA